MSGTEISQSTGTTAADRVADVLLLFGQTTATLGVSDIAKTLGLGKSVVHRILQSLVSRGLVRFDPVSREYELGSTALTLGVRALRDHGLRQAARGPLRALRDRTTETTTLSELVGHSRMYLEQFESPQEIRMTVDLGILHPLHAGASSRAILAFLPAETQEHVLSGGLRQLTPVTISEADRLRSVLDEVRRTGVAVSRGERQHGAGSVAAPLFDMDGDVTGAISVCGPATRFDDDVVQALTSEVRQTAELISHTIGWDGRSEATTGDSACRQPLE